jgi:UDP-3-O-[3-hydroxymyristoyl] glucosamine N-acyltransferase
MRVVIVGAGGHGQVVADMIAAGARVGDDFLHLAGFLDDAPGLVGTEVGGVPVIAKLVGLSRVAADAFVVAIGSNSERARISQQLQSAGRLLVSVQHPQASVSGTVTIGEGTMVSAGAVDIGDYTHIAPGVHLGGEVSIGGRALVGIGAVALPRCRVGGGCTSGAGAVVIGEVPDGVTMVLRGHSPHARAAES